MPLYELYRLARENLDKENSDAQADQSLSPDSDFFELIWENGQISTQGQSSRVRRSPSCRSLPSHCLPSHSPNGRDKDVGYVTHSKIGKFGDLDTGLSEIAISVPSAEMDLVQDEDAIPWLDYAMESSLHDDYGSEFLHELSGVTEPDLPTSNSFALIDKRSNGNQAFRDSHKSSAEDDDFSKCSLAGEADAARPKPSSNQLYPPALHQSQTSLVSGRSRVSDITERNTGNAVLYPPVTEIPSSSSDFSSLKTQKQDPISNGTTVMNFSHFARPAALIRANLQNIDLKSGLSLARSGSMGNMNKCAGEIISSPPEPTLGNSSSEWSKEQKLCFQKIVEQSNDDLKSLEPNSLEQNAVASKQSDLACEEKAMKVDQNSNQILDEIGAKGQMGAETIMEPAVASSSVCSGNGGDRGSDEPKQSLKRKSRDTEDSECHSEDIEDESVGVKKVASGRGATGSKRSRAAEVHNLSERRRRDRINEKMRALQELIPNCNKVDKASMLDEAIEYLKTLQLQVQIMSMGAGLYVPPMMLPPGMQYMHGPQMAPFSHMGIGMQMGMAMGYGMGMPDMSGVSSRFPMFQVPQMQAVHLPTALPGVSRSNPQGFGLPGHGFPMPVPRAPVFPFSGGPLMNSSTPGLHAGGTTGLIQTVDPASTSGLKNPVPNVDPQVKQRTDDSDSTSQVPTQCEAAPVGFEPSASVNDSGAC